MTSPFLERPIRDIDAVIAQCRRDIETARTVTQAAEAAQQLRRLLAIKAYRKQAE